jgi:hypothetical protein
MLNMSEGNQVSDFDDNDIPVELPVEDITEKTSISLYEFYALGIERLIVKAPWELERSVSPYYERFLTEQRCMGLAILLLLGENLVPQASVQSMPGYEAQARFSVNQAVFRRALKHYFESSKLNPIRADMVIERMGSYIADSREAEQKQSNPLEAMFGTLVKRVPPRNEKETDQYASRVEKIYDYVSGLVNTSLLSRYEIVP